MTEQQTDFDSPWKEALEHYFQAFMALFFPKAHGGIAWEHGYEFLDKELQQVVRDAELGRRLADKLVKVWRTDGEETWVLIHIEVQGQPEPDFARRMYTYNYRLFDRYDRQIVSLAVLGDESPGWRPAEFGYALWGCEVSLRFPTVKLLDYRARWDELDASANPFAIVIMAHLKAQETRADPESRLEWKLRLFRRLYGRGFLKQDILELFRFIDWLLWLPDELTQKFRQAVAEYEEEKRMPYVTSIELLGRQEGRQDATRENVVMILRERFAAVPPALVEALNRIDDLGTLRSLLRRAVTVERPEELGLAF
jgi:hypothetical protein